MAETEKITMNMSVVDLGQIDLLVKEGFFSSRTDFIRSAIRNQLNNQAQVVQDAVTRRSFAMGIISYSRSDLEERRLKGVRLQIRVLGMLILASDITPELAQQTIDSIEVFGALRTSEAVKKALGERIKK